MSATNAMELSGVLDFMQGLQFISFLFYEEQKYLKSGKTLLVAALEKGK